MSEFEDGYDLGEKIGSGAFAEVYKCTSKSSGNLHAVKIIENAEDNVQAEITILKSLSHENIVRLIDVFSVHKTIYMVQELIMGGEMFDYIIDKGTYNEADASKAFRMILQGLEYLHSKGILHRDLKPENILLSEKSENAVIKIADFGLAKVISEQGMTTTTCGTPGYVAPEVLCQKDYGTAVDVWAAGVILYIMVSGYEPFFHENETQMFKNIMSGKYTFPPELFHNVSEELVSLIKRILVIKAQQRPTALECLADPWLKTGTEGSESNQLSTAWENLSKRQAKKRLKGALIAVRLGGRIKNPNFFTSSSPNTNISPPKAVINDEAKEESKQVVVDLDVLLNEINTQSAESESIVKDEPTVNEAVKPEELEEGIGGLPGQTGE